MGELENPSRNLITYSKWAWDNPKWPPLHWDLDVNLRNGPILGFLCSKYPRWCRDRILQGDLPGMEIPNLLPWNAFLHHKMCWSTCLEGARIGKLHGREHGAPRLCRMMPNVGATDILFFLQINTTRHLGSTKNEKVESSPFGVTRGVGHSKFGSITTTLNMIFSGWLYLVLLPPYHAQH